MSTRWLRLLVWILPSCITLFIVGVVANSVVLSDPENFPTSGAATLFSAVRNFTPEKSSDTPETIDDEKMAFLRAWRNGKEIARHRYTKSQLQECMTSGRSCLPKGQTLGSWSKVTAKDRSAAALQLDVMVATSPILNLPDVIIAFALVPGLDGVAAELSDGSRQVLLPDELIRSKMFAGIKPAPDLPDLKFGLDKKRLFDTLAKNAGMKRAEFDKKITRLFRFRTLSFLQPTQQSEVLQLVRGKPAAPLASRHTLRDAALAGGRYLVKHLNSEGRYIYRVDIATGKASNPKNVSDYSLPRHAGVTYFLAELYRHTKEAWLLEPLQRAITHFADLVTKSGCYGTSPAPFRCLADTGENVAVLGSTALAVVALVEYRRATGDSRYDQLSKELTEWILLLQHSDGSFTHEFDVASLQAIPGEQQLYYSGEAALALARMHTVFGDPRYAKASEKALDWLIRFYDFFVGGFFFGEEHWTCIASEALADAITKPAYLQFCRDYGDFLRRHQWLPGDSPENEDLAGTYGFTPFAVPNNTPMGSRTEAMLSAYQLSVKHGQPDQKLWQQNVLAMQMALRQQIREDQVLWQGADLAGGFTSSPVEPVIRIDYVQHIGSAMLRTSELMP